MATEQEYDEIIAPMIADVANKCAELGMNIIARVEWEPGESGITQMGDMSKSFGQIMTRAAALSHGNIDSLLLHLVKNYDVSASIFLAKYAKESAA